MYVLQQTLSIFSSKNFRMFETNLEMALKSVLQKECLVYQNTSKSFFVKGDWSRDKEHKQFSDKIHFVSIHFLY